MSGSSKVRLSRDGAHYVFTGERFVATVWRFRSAYGDYQWGCDVEWTDGRRSVDYSQFDYLADARRWVAILAEGQLPV